MRRFFFEIPNYHAHYVNLTGDLHERWMFYYLYYGNYKLPRVFYFRSKITFPQRNVCKNSYRRKWGNRESATASLIYEYYHSFMSDE